MARMWLIVRTAKEHIAMGMIILIVIGSIFGWLAAIMIELKTHDALLWNMAVGSGGALLLGFLSNESSLLTGISILALMAAMLGSIFALVILSVLRRQIVA